MRQRAKLTSWGLAVPVLVLAVGAQAEIWSRPLPGSNPCWSPARWRPRCRCSARVGARWRLAGWPSPQSRCWRSRRPRRPTTRPPTFAGLAAAFLVARYGSRRHALAGLAAALATLLLVARDQPGLAAAVATFVITAVLVGVTWGTGFTLRERHRHADEAKRRAVRAEADRDTATRLAVAEERARIARELHDIVAHAVSVMVLQSGAIRHNLPDTLTDDKDALYAVEGVGREALTEMRRLLKAMREDDEDDERAPQPGLAGVPRLIEDVSRAGLAASLNVEGRPRPLPQGVELSAYRIVQEGLTNSLKHVHAHRVDVRLAYVDHALEVEIRDDGAGRATAGDLGYGLVGVRERVKLYGGEMSAGVDTGGGFVLRTRLPFDEGRSR